MNAGARFYPSRCGGHKNSGNVATFPEFLGRRKNLAPAFAERVGADLCRGVDTLATKTP